MTDALVGVATQFEIKNVRWKIWNLWRGTSNIDEIYLRNFGGGEIVYLDISPPPKFRPRPTAPPRPFPSRGTMGAEQSNMGMGSSAEGVGDKARPHLAAWCGRMLGCGLVDG